MGVALAIIIALGNNSCYLKILLLFYFDIF
jgi:hypothetical protein